MLLLFYCTLEGAVGNLSLILHLGHIVLSHGVWGVARSLIAKVAGSVLWSWSKQRVLRSASSHTAHIVAQIVAYVVIAHIVARNLRDVLLIQHHSLIFAWHQAIRS